MHNAPIASVVVIFLNARAFLKQAIESVIAQTYQNWELILVDDGSNDGSSEVALRYARLCPTRISYVEHERHRNLGKSTSRNLGLQKAQGDYVAFLDADDVWLPQKLAEQIKVLESNPRTVMVYGPSLYWYTWSGEGAIQGTDAVSSVGVTPQQIYDPPVLMRLFLLNGGIVPGICSLVARRPAVAMLGGFDESIQDLYEDQTLIAKLCLHGPVYVDNGCWDKYRQHRGSSSFQAIASGVYHPWRPNKAKLTFLLWLAQYLKEQSIADPDLWSAMEHQLWPYRYPRLGYLLGIVRSAIEFARVGIHRIRCPQAFPSSRSVNQREK